MLWLDCSEQPSSDVLGVASRKPELVGLVEDGQGFLADLTVHAEQTRCARLLGGPSFHHIDSAVCGNAVLVDHVSKFRRQVQEQVVFVELVQSLR